MPLHPVQTYYDAATTSPWPAGLACPYTYYSTNRPNHVYRFYADASLQGVLERAQACIAASGAGARGSAEAACSWGSRRHAAGGVVTVSGCSGGSGDTMVFVAQSASLTGPYSCVAGNE